MSAMWFAAALLGHFRRDGNTVMGLLAMCAGDHLYRMDYTPFVQKHRESGADITVAALPMDAERAEAFGVMKVPFTAPQHQCCRSCAVVLRQVGSAAGNVCCRIREAKASGSILCSPLALTSRSLLPRAPPWRRQKWQGGGEAGS